MTAFLPALLIALFAAWAGTFHGAAGWAGALAGDVAACGFALVAAPRLRDPLRLGRGADLLLAALLAVVAASVAASPVPRAALEPLAILPAFLLFPAAVEWAWRDDVRRRSGRRLLALVAGAVALWSLAHAIANGAGRAAAPLGHHGALASFLLVALPFAALTARDHGAWRIAGIASTVLCAAAVLATRSLVGAALLLVQAFLLAPRSRARWLVAAVTVTAVIAWNAPRLLALARGDDPSAAARRAYFAAGVLGLRERPALGWGPGSVGWTIGLELPPSPGRNPPGEVVSYLHFLPLDLAWQLGVAGALLAVGTISAFFFARRTERPIADDPGLHGASMVALLSGLGALVFTGFQPLRANMAMLAVAAGATLASSASRGPALSDRARRNARIAVLLYTACALGVLAPVRRAHRLYDQARAGGDAFALLDRAVERDASFALYAARRAWAAVPADALAVESAGGQTVGSRAAGEALRAAERAPGVAALWLAAGLLGADSGAPWAEPALRQACDLDPLGAMAPFRLMTIARDEATAAIAGARALLAEPRLAAAIEWDGREPLFARALEEVGTWPGVAPVWRERAVAALRALPAFAGGPTRTFYLELDGEAQTSLSLFVFRRLPWPTRLGSIELDEARLRGADVGSAALRADTEPRAFARNGCGRGE